MAAAVYLNHNFFMVSVLLIEDAADLRAEIKLGLEKAGHTVTEAASGDEGIVLFAKQPVDVVITDVIMDKGEGIETLHRLHDRAPELPVIAISGNPRSSTYLRLAETFGVDHTLEKPFPFGVLQATIETLVHH